MKRAWFVVVLVGCASHAAPPPHDNASAAPSSDVGSGIGLGDIDGKVSSASPDASGTTLPDPQTVDCVVDVFRTLEFPKPEGGIVTVVYPLIFSPGDP